jgi:polysaccharide export outer membrane protein
LIEQELISNPIVTVEFENLTFSVLGEVENPGRYNITKDHLTLLDAISMAGDLKITGKRTDIIVLRNEDNQQKSYKINLCSANELYSSPAFYLKQNDVVYIQPNDMRTRQSTINGNNVRSSSFWISLASLLTSVTMLFVK